MSVPRPALAVVTGGYIDSTVKINHTTTNGPTFLPDVLVTYGATVGTIGDLNDDGVDDLLAGATLYDGGGANRGGALVHFMNTDGTMDATARISDNTANGPVLGDSDSYGACVSGIGDLNDDGVEDMIVGAASNDTGGTARGAAFISFMNTDGSVDSTVRIDSTVTNGPTLADNALYGAGCAGLGDLNGDGVEDIAVSANEDNTGGSTRGAMFIHYMNTDGSIDSTVKIASGTANLQALSNGSLFGTSIANIGDLNGDGVIDLAVGARNEPPAASGGVYVLFMNTDGTLDSSVRITASTTNGPAIVSGDRFGVSVTALGDWNGDGVRDIGAGAYLDDTGGNARGAVYVMLMNTDGSVDETYKIDDNTVNGATLADGNNYGSGIASVDLNGDGKRELFVGASGDTSQRGATFLHFMREVVPTTSNTVTLSRLKISESSTVSVSFGLSSVLTGQLKVTFPAGFTVTGAATSGTCSGGGTLGTFAFTSSTLTATKTGCSGTVTMSGATVTNPGTPGSYRISWVNDDPGEAAVAITAEDQINVTATVDPYITFDLEASTTTCANNTSSPSDHTPNADAYEVDFGALSPTTVGSSDAGGVGHICTFVSTNAGSGYTLSVRSANGQLVSGSNAIPVSPQGTGTTTTVAGSSSYTMCQSDTNPDGKDTTNPAGTDFTPTANFDGTCTGTNANGDVGGNLTTSTQNIGSTPGGAQESYSTWLLKAAITATTAAGTYTDTLTFVATGTF